MASKAGAYALSDRVLLRMSLEHIGEAVAILRRSQDSDRVSPHISSIRKVKSHLEDLYRDILVEKSS